MNKITKFAALVALAASASLHNMALAHPEHDTPAPRVEAAEMKANLHAAKMGATISVTKGGETVSTAGATGTLKLLDAKNTHAYVLKPAPGNTMMAKGVRKLAKGARAQVDITFADKSTLSSELTAN
ncbi:MAG: hypothetical protein Q7K57_26720 [Burkholderiaceae bacterium]|nr:hypothetical protein [Burkholderiaceae bacterium]